MREQHCNTITTTCCTTLCSHNSVQQQYLINHWDCNQRETQWTKQQTQTEGWLVDNMDQMKTQFSKNECGPEPKQHRSQVSFSALSSVRLWHLRHQRPIDIFVVLERGQECSIWKQLRLSQTNLRATNPLCSPNQFVIRRLLEYTFAPMHRRARE